MDFSCTKCRTTKSTNTVKGCIGYHDDDGDHPCPNKDRVDTSTDWRMVAIGVVILILVALVMSAIL